jgi:hypothetical protein
MQKVIILTGFWDTNDNGNWNDSSDEVNDLLADGWLVKNMIPMGSVSFGYGYGTAYGYGYAGGETNASHSDHDIKIYHNDFHGFASLLLLER